MIATKNQETNLSQPKITEPRPQQTIKILGFNWEYESLHANNICVAIIYI